jgi:hypothetical protein
MLNFGQKSRWFLKLNISFLFLIIFSSCGISGNESKTRITEEKGMAGQKADVALNNNVETIKDLKVANTEKATFALG